MVYEYLVADIIGLVILGIVYAGFPRLRKVIVWGSLTGAGIVVGLTIVLNVVSLFVDILPRWVPDYWDPPQLFDLARTFQISIEDALFFIFVSGMVSVLYEIVTKHFVRDRKKRHLHLDAIVLAIMLYIFIAGMFRMNVVYALVIAQMLTGVYVAIRRPDLIRHLLASSALFVVFYALFFWLVLLLWPHFTSYWNLRALSGIVILGIPLEELLWAASHGIFFGPLYEYVRHARLR